MNCFNTCMGSHEVVQFRCVCSVCVGLISFFAIVVEAVFNFSSDYDLLFYLCIVMCAHGVKTDFF